MSDAATEPSVSDPDTSEPGGAALNFDEQTWLVRHCRGDKRAFPALLEFYGPRVYAYLVRCGIRDADRDDVCQTVFLKIHASAASFDASRPLAPWIFTIVVNTVRDHFRNCRVNSSPVANDGSLEISDPNPGPERTAAARESLAWLERALRTLPFAQREVLVLATIVGLRQQDIAQSLNLPLNTVKTHLRRARLKLAEDMDEREMPGCTGDTDDQL
jgi:RNA polymerase sigma-70 factor (ECF subfamily)